MSKKPVDKSSGTWTERQTMRLTSIFGQGNNTPSKQAPAVPTTPLLKLLGDSDAVREDGSDKFYGMENFGNTCYCNSVLQCLYYSQSFRERILNFPAQPRSIASDTDSTAASDKKANGIDKKKPVVPVPPPTGPRPEDNKESPEYKKKAAIAAGPIVTVNKSNAKSYGMELDEYTAMKDLFEALVDHQSRTGVLSPQKFIEVLKAENPMFQGNAHQDAHEFLMLVLEKLTQSVDNYMKSSPGISIANGTTEKPKNWVTELFGGTLRSETKCLTCENVSRRDEPFNDLSIDMESDTSVSTCLRNFCGSEILCEGNKFHCDHCGGLQEADKRTRIHSLPKMLCLHLKRFRYLEDQGRHGKLFHRVTYPFHLRVWTTTEESEDQDKLYELYGVVVHIGGGPAHGHYVSIIKTQGRGWLLFDDEMVEPVEKTFLTNFFGDKPGQATAYVLFYQETTLENVMREQEAESFAELRAEEAERAAMSPQTLDGKPETLSPSKDRSPEREKRASGEIVSPAVPTVDTPSPLLTPQVPKSKKERAKEEKEAKAAAKEREKAEKLREKEREKEAEYRRKEMERQKRLSEKSGYDSENRKSGQLFDLASVDNGKSYTDFPNEASDSGSTTWGSLSRFKPSSKSLSGRGKLWGSAKDRDHDADREAAASPLLSRVKTEGNAFGMAIPPTLDESQPSDTANGTVPHSTSATSSEELMNGVGAPLAHSKTLPLLDQPGLTYVNGNVANGHSKGHSNGHSNGSNGYKNVADLGIDQGFKPNHGSAHGFPVFENGTHKKDKDDKIKDKERRTTSLRNAFGLRKKTAT